SITIQNMSGIAAKNAIVGSRLPAQISFLSDSSNSCSSLQGFMVCQLGDLAAFSSTNLQIEYQVNLGRKENIRHDLRVSSNEFETPQEFSDNLLSINSKCKR
ncbi:hypothetical protein L0152_28040, partial [bacterium]|nr:hypothetical protein [bacterium]